MRWNLKPTPDSEKIKSLQDSLNIDELIATLLLQRGIETFEQARQFFRPKLEDLHDPYLMKDMDKAVARIEKAIEKQENILVFGDYDVDGTTAVSLVSSYLKSFYPNVDTYIPDRYDEGYGVSFKGIDYADDNGITLIIALDCGIKSIDHVAYAKEKNIDFIICDHHRPGDTLPDAVAVLDPKREDCHYPYDELCGCGIGFKLLQALAKNRNQTIEDLRPYLDLVATAIGADIVPITGENRVLAKFGLEVINSNPRPGFKAITQNLKKKNLTITDVVFILAPRINAAGRIKHGNYAVKLLTEFGIEEAEAFAKELEVFNADRKELDKQITSEALLQIIENQEEDRYSTVVYKEDWHKGVIGIVASRLIETYYRPTLVFTKSGDKLAASARSVKDFDVYNALEACSEYLLQFGGHMYAAGLTLEEAQFENFKAQFEKVISETIPEELRTPEILIDAVINLNDITEKFVRILNQFEPFGPMNMMPVFMTENLRDTGYGKRIGSDESHLRLFVKQDDSEGYGYGAIGFGMGNKFELTQNQQPFDAVYSLEENEFNGNVSLQLRLRDIKGKE
ncbi:MAG: single-stranded-DNA-specific exonuclease RecJ [Flavobacterium lindanitolerans]|uniref:single-stranded-DNA-specific exonuclease RecJ n=1 Tax=Flavobacterium lindanitolerans TaxID=428988 RepID=UPI001A3C262A|nr:single-stranded-DNA-specific exonuclease RecJ [Flavobacterium lindanitolerans]MBL7866816.1 single-stranded-DNA-specific exonuclease RecJ [Flavobacterium lindanitolerans]